MNVLIRGVNPSSIKKIDEVVKKNGMSRNEYLKVQLENTTLLNGLNNEYERYELALRKLYKATDLINVRTKSLEEGLNKLIKTVSIALSVPED